MKARTRKRSKDAAVLISVAESIGTALGVIAAKANAAQKAILRSGMERALEREFHKLARTTRRSAKKAGKAGSAAARGLRKSKAGIAARRAGRRGMSAAKRAARRK